METLLGLAAAVIMASLAAGLTYGVAFLVAAGAHAGWTF